MALNKSMHPRNRYKDKPPDFAYLASKYPEFQQHVHTNLTGRVGLNFKDPEAVRALTCTLLKEDFGLSIEIPLERLIPTVPLRLNYIHWVEDLIGAAGDAATRRGIDIGTGASCIYPLLGATMNGWFFLATEVDDICFNFAKKNVEHNGLSDLIKVVKVPQKTLLMDALKEESALVFDFCMCNPPFFANQLEAKGVNSRNSRRAPPSSVNTGGVTEIMAEGGELEFVKRIIHDSLQLKGRLRWYSCMLGKKCSLAPLKEELRKQGWPSPKPDPSIPESPAPLSCLCFVLVLGVGELGGRLNFKDPEAVRALTCTLLKEDFGLSIEIPLERLIPTVPLRLNYIHWVEDLIGAAGDAKTRRGIDIGTGASCIYPLLGATMNGWFFLATEVDDICFNFAKKNVEHNGLSDLIKVVKVPQKTLLMDALKEESALVFDFCMCNPPFFANQLEAKGVNSRNSRRAPPSSVNTGGVTEIMAEGGELEFVKRIIHDSLQLKGRLRWYSCMLGKKCSLAPLKEELRKQGVPKVTHTEFCQGRTMRWALAWSFYDDVAVPSPPCKKRKLEKARKPLSFSVLKPTVKLLRAPESEDPSAAELITTWLEKGLTQLRVLHKRVPGEEAELSLFLTAVENSWVHIRQRRRDHGRQLRELPQGPPCWRQRHTAPRRHAPALAGAPGPGVKGHRYTRCAGRRWAGRTGGRGEGGRLCCGGTGSWPRPTPQPGVSPALPV
ncbi:hypothetical protein SKAU_G00321360 [Synaphobranchus kaupii]|uniref:RNA N(6)-adenosine-methyltransferase METTL16 n=1 Tax=Synaphobranchus kaupii TaxID=118154 RepID=A0A9Q1IHN3_SYNKA|nr:hypothetical protein SKAU_G00321360 [Synaphobranchus kaupii]